MELNEVFNYNPDSGEITWKIKPRRSVKQGQIAGTLCRGYIRILYLGKHVFAHRLAWFLSTGNWPKEYIDHVNGIKNDNRLCNLKETTTSLNAKNTYKHRNNEIKYYCWDTRNKNFRITSRVNGKVILWGKAKTEAEAVEYVKNNLEKIKGLKI